MRDLHEILRAESAHLHERLETLPFFKALHAGTLPRTAIASYLRSLAIIHAVLERCLSEVSSGPLVRLLRHAPVKVPLLAADLDALGTEGYASITTAIRIALDYAAEILEHGDDPLTLVGVLYVLEGSQNGALVLKRAHARCLNVPEERLSYFGCYGSATAVRWREFTECLNSLTLEASQINAVVQAANRCFEQLERICARLYPYDDADLKHHVAAVNFEAGDHAMPQNPRDIALALRVGRASWVRYPYLEQRYGERGKRFNSSDSCWLVALTGMSVESATKSLEWLRTVLATRGIATVILEDHLAALAQELAAESPGEPRPCTHYERFLSARAAERRALFDAESLRRLIDRFDRRLRSSAGLTVESAAKLITSAWVDERCGIAGALAAVRDWFVDAERFSSDWIASVNELLVSLDQAKC